MKYKIVACHVSLASKLYPHYDEFIIEAKNIKEAKEVFEKQHNDYFVDKIAVITSKEELEKQCLKLDRALTKMCELMEKQEKDSCYYCPVGKENCVDLSQKNLGSCSSKKWKEWSLNS